MSVLDEVLQANESHRQDSGNKAAFAPFRW